MSTERPAVKRGDWISIGDKDQNAGVVSNIYDTRPSVIEIVHLKNGNKPLFEDIKWNGSYWEFTNTAVSGGYAKLHNRLQPYVEILMNGRRVTEENECALGGFQIED